MHEICNIRFLTIIDNGFRIESFRTLMKELCFKNHSPLMMQREHHVMKRKDMVEVDPNDKEIFSSFSDRQKHSRIMTSASYLTNVYKKHHCAIKNCMAKEMKKRAATASHFDVSYEEAKRLCQHK